MLAAKARALLGVVGLEALADVRADRLQHSELRFIEIARALMLDPDFLLLDEPAAGLSTDEIERLGELIKAISRARHRRAAGRAPCRPDLRHLPPGHRAQSRPHARRRHAGRNSRRTRRWSVLISAAEPLLSVTRLESGYGKIRVLHGVDMSMRRGRGGGAARAQRRRQDHAAARDVRPAAGQCRRGALRRPRHRRHHARARRRAPASCMSSRAIACSPRSRSPTICCSPATICRAASAPRASRRRCRSFPEIAAKRHERGGALVRRPAADAGGGAGAGAPAASPDARRAFGRPVAGAGRSRAQRHRAVARSREPRCCWSSSCWKRRSPPPTASMRWCRAISRWKRRPARATCRSGWSAPISAMRATRWRRRSA